MKFLQHLILRLLPLGVIAGGGCRVVLFRRFCSE